MSGGAGRRATCIRYFDQRASKVTRTAKVKCPFCLGIGEPVPDGLEVFARYEIEGGLIMQYGLFIFPLAYEIGCPIFIEVREDRLQLIGGRSSYLAVRIGLKDTLEFGFSIGEVPSSLQRFAPLQINLRNIAGCIRCFGGAWKCSSERIKVFNGAIKLTGGPLFLSPSIQGLSCFGGGII